MRVPKPSSESIAVIVPATDDAPHLPQCLAAIAASSRQPDELVVVREPAGIGPAMARNLGAERVDSELVVFVDSDVSLSSTALAKIAQRFADDPELDAVFGAYDASPSDPGAVSRFRNLAHREVHLASAGRVESFWSGLGAIRRDRLIEIGGFDSDRFPAPSIEDVELGARLAARGFKIELDPSIVGTHHKRWTIWGMVETDFSARAVPWAELVLEGRLPARGLNLSSAHRVAALASVGAALGLAARRPGLVGVGLMALALARARLLRILGESGGARLIASGVPLLLLHHLSAAAAVPCAFLRVYSRRRRAARASE